jgi:hypothetical protein
MSAPTRAELEELLWRNWIYTPQPDGVQVVVTVPMLGDFPDEESATNTVYSILADPAQIQVLLSK